MPEAKRKPLAFLAGVLAMILSDSEGEARSALSMLRRKARDESFTGGALREIFETASDGAEGRSGSADVRLRMRLADRDARIEHLEESNTRLQGRIDELEAEHRALEEAARARAASSSPGQPVGSKGAGKAEAHQAHPHLDILV